MVLDTSLLNTQQYKLCIKDKVEQSRERGSAPYTLVWYLLKRELSGHPRPQSPTLLTWWMYLHMYIYNQACLSTINSERHVMVSFLDTFLKILSDSPCSIHFWVKTLGPMLRVWISEPLVVFQLIFWILLW